MRRRAYPEYEGAGKKRNAYECRMPVRTTADPRKDAPVGFSSARSVSRGSLGLRDDPVPHRVSRACARLLAILINSARKSLASHVRARVASTRDPYIN